jgi:carbonic anhydrase/acetyltransferase-like protein (isoleucine patch superfamily)
MPTLICFEGRSPQIAATAFIAPTAVLIGNVVVGEGASILFGAVLRGDLGPIRIGAESNVQDNTVIHAETEQGTVLEERVTVGHNAILHDCWLERGCVIGMGAILLQRTRVGREAMVGAGSVVREGFEIPGRMLAVGAPAIIKKPLEGNAAQWITRAADDYIGLRQRYHGNCEILAR